MLRLCIPSKENKYDYLSCIKEWGKFEKIPTSPDNFFYGNSYEEFLDYVIGNMKKPQGGRVPETLFFVYDNKNLIGTLDLRHHIDHDFLKEYAGHIAYGVIPKYRGQGYGTKILKKGLKEAKKIGIKKALLVCKYENVASKKIIKKNGGIFDRYTYWGTQKLCRYYISI